MMHYSEWSKYAYCKGWSIETFFGRPGKSLNEARRMCRICPVQRDCLEYAIANREEGFWGGKSQVERSKMSKKYIRDFITEAYRQRGWLHYQQTDGIVIRERHRLQEERRLGALSLESANDLLQDD